MAATFYELRLGIKKTMTVNSSDYVGFVMDQLASLRGISSGRFFGGVGLSADGIQFAMIMGSSLYFVVDDSSREKYERWIVVVSRISPRRAG